MPSIPNNRSLHTALHTAQHLQGASISHEELVFIHLVCKTFLFNTELWIRFQLLQAVSRNTERFQADCSSIAAIAVVQSAAMLANSCMALYQFWESVRYAPKEASVILDDLALLSTVLQDVSHDEELASQVKLALERCRTKIWVLSSRSLLSHPANQSRRNLTPSSGNSIQLSLP